MHFATFSKESFCARVERQRKGHLEVQEGCQETPLGNHGPRAVLLNLSGTHEPPEDPVKMQLPIQ